jgi:hypothetical protein
LRGIFPKELPIYQGYVHIGFYLGWAVERGFAGSLLIEDFAQELEQLRTGKITGPRLLEITDGVLDDQMLSDAGNRFTADYYESDYVADYADVFSSEETLYHVQDTPTNFAKIRGKLDARLEEWRAKHP